MLQLATQIVGSLLALEAMDETAPIRMYINSPGGQPYSVIGVVDAMQAIKPHIQTVSLGACYSYSSLILVRGLCVVMGGAGVGGGALVCVCSWGGDKGWRKRGWGNMQAIKPPIQTVALGVCYSYSSLILVKGLCLAGRGGMCVDRGGATGRRGDRGGGAACKYVYVRRGWGGLWVDKGLRKRGGGPFRLSTTHPDSGTGRMLQLLKPYSGENKTRDCLRVGRRGGGCKCVDEGGHWARGWGVGVGGCQHTSQDHRCAGCRHQDVSSSAYRGI